MTKGTPDEQAKYTNLPLLTKVMMSGTFEPMTISLSAKHTYVWMRLGGEQKVLDLIAPPGICAHCSEEKVWLASFQGWFCYTCHQNLKHLGLLPYND